jgi:hypothetical protein
LNISYPENNTMKMTGIRKNNFFHPNIRETHNTLSIRLDGIRLLPYHTI